MFDQLSTRLTDIFATLTKRGALRQEDVDTALREVRRALLEADVALEVVKQFVETVRTAAVGQQVIKSVSPGQQVIKIVHDAMVELLGTDGATLNLNVPAPALIMMVGLQGSGKTTSTGKLALWLKTREKKKVLLASLDTRRPAAQEQLAILGTQAGIDTLPIIAGQQPIEIARRAMSEAKLGGYDVVFLDTAGRTHVDEALVQELKDIRAFANPADVLFVADALTGQDAVVSARAFDEAVNITGAILTRIDGDGRGGAALSVRAITGKPIKFLGTGEKLDAIEAFTPQRMADRILGMGDIVALVEKASQTIDAEAAQKMAQRMAKGNFDLADMATQLQQMQAMGGLGGVMGMLPGMGKMKDAMKTANINDNTLKRQLAVIQSMTPKERAKPDLLNFSRKKRIAAGSGTSLEEINKVLKMHRQMADMMKMMGGKGMGGMGGGLASKLGGMFGMGGGGMPQMPKGMPQGLPSPDQMQELMKSMPKGGAGMPGLGGLPGLGAPNANNKLPGFPFGANQGLPKGKK